MGILQKQISNPRLERPQSSPLKTSPCPRESSLSDPRATACWSWGLKTLGDEATLTAANPRPPTPTPCLQVTRLPRLLSVTPHPVRLPEEEIDQYATPCRTREMPAPWGIMQGLGRPLLPVTRMSQSPGWSSTCPREQARASPYSPGLECLLQKLRPGPSFSIPVTSATPDGFLLLPTSSLVPPSPSHSLRTRQPKRRGLQGLDKKGWVRC